MKTAFPLSCISLLILLGLGGYHFQHQTNSAQAAVSHVPLAERHAIDFRETGSWSPGDSEPGSSHHTAASAAVGPVVGQYAPSPPLSGERSLDDGLLPGLVIPLRKLPLRSPVSGVVCTVPGAEGETTAVEQELLRLDDREGREDLAAMQSRLKSIRESIRLAQVRYETIRADYRRKQHVNERRAGIVTDAALFQVEQEGKSVRIDVARLAHDYRALQHEITGTEIALDRYVIKSPMPGVLRQFNVAAGQYVERGETLGWIDSNELLVKVQLAGGVDPLLDTTRFQLAPAYAAAAQAETSSDNGGRENDLLSVYQVGDFNPDGSRDVFLRPSSDFTCQAGQIVTIQVSP